VNLEQSRIDNAFKKKQRITTSRTNIEGKEYWLLNGKQTGNYGVVSLKVVDNIEIQVTDLERTLIDIAVRPAYAGGVKSVLEAYRLAQSKVSISKLTSTLRALNYIYPYHQSVGFYMETAGTYSLENLEEFLNFRPLDYDFYLDYEMKTPAYSSRWKIYYPEDLIL
jgi:predicted transcriptional regulator of viral defense system